MDDPDFLEVPPTWRPVALTCNVCDRVWNEWQPWGVPLATWIAHARSWKCPECGAGSTSISLRTKP